MDETTPAFDWTAFWAGVSSFVDAWQVPLKVVLVLIVAFVLNWALRILIHRTVDRVVNGAKKKHSVNDTQALISSPLAAARITRSTEDPAPFWGSARQPRSTPPQARTAPQHRAKK